MNLESFRALKLSNLYALLSPERKFFGTHVWYGLRSKRSKEEEKREKTPVRVATTFCLCTPKGSARTPLGPISSTYCILLLLFRTQRLIDRYCGSIPKFSFLGCLNCNDNIVWWKNYLWHDHKNKIGDNPSPPGIHLFQTKHAQNFPEIWTPPPLHQVCKNFQFIDGGTTDWKEVGQKMT